MNTFSDKYLSKYAILTQAVVGFEFEFYSETAYHKLMELLNVQLKPLRIHGFGQYHSSFTPDADNFKIEPDFSGGPDMVELVTGPMPYVDARGVLLRIFKFMQQHCYTDEHCSIHVNISFREGASAEIAELNQLALLLDFDEEAVYRLFPSRRGNIYAKSIKRVIPFEDWDDADAAVNVVSNHLHLPIDTKYYGINLQKKEEGWLEYRYIGGKDYEKNGAAVLELMDYFVLATHKACGEKLNPGHTVKLRAYLDDNITALRNFRQLDVFLASYPKIELRVDKDPTYDTLNAYYERFYERLFDLLHKSQLNGNCIVNFDSEANRIEVIGATITGLYDIVGVDLIDCALKDAHVRSCELVGCDIRNSHILQSNLRDTDTHTSRVISCNVYSNATLTDCYFMDGKMMGRMVGGVLRSGTIGPEADISKETKTLRSGGFWSFPKEEEATTKKGTAGKPDKAMLDAKGGI